MPNWCNTTFVIEGDKKEVESLFLIMDELEHMDRPLVANGFGKQWLGCLVEKLGGDWEKIYCRGDWQYKELREDGNLHIDTESAWSPPLEVFWLVKSKFPNLRIYWQSEEPGMEEYWTNDAEGKYFHERYYLEACDPDGEFVHEYFKNEQDCVNFIRGKYEIEIQTIDDVESVQEYWDEIDDDNPFICVHEYLIDNNDKLL